MGQADPARGVCLNYDGRKENYMKKMMRKEETFEPEELHGNAIPDKTDTATGTEEGGAAVVAAAAPKPRGIKLRKAGTYLKSYWSLYLCLLPGFVILLIFTYVPMYGITLAFRDYIPKYGLWESPWGVNGDIWYHFKTVFATYGLWELLRNTLWLGLLGLIFAFPSSIVLALLINELGNKTFKKAVQTISYLPYFLGWAIVATIVYSFFSRDMGIINNVLEDLFGVRVSWYSEPKWWPWILTFVGIWKTTGWGTITFLAGISGIDPTLYEAAEMDGAGRWKQTWHVTIPGIMPVIGITFTLTVANIVRDDFEKIYTITGNSDLLGETTNVLGTWAYSTMLGGFRNYGQVTVVTFLQSIVGLILMVGANWLVKKLDANPLW